MSTVTTHKVGGLPMSGQGRVCLLRKKFDCAVDTLTAAEVIEVFDIPKDTFVLAVGVRCETAEGATATIDIGDETNADGFIDGADMNSASTNASSNNVTAGGTNAAFGVSVETTGGGKYYTDADTIDILVNNTMDAAAFTVWALVAYCGDPA